MATAGTSLQAEVLPDKFTPLRTALVREKQEAIVGAAKVLEIPLEDFGEHHLIASDVELVFSWITEKALGE